MNGPVSCSEELPRPMLNYGSGPHCSEQGSAEQDRNRQHRHAGNGPLPQNGVRAQQYGTPTNCKANAAIDTHRDVAGRDAR